MKTKMLPLTVVENGGRYEVRLDGRLIQIRTRSGTLMEAVDATRLAVMQIPAPRTPWRWCALTQSGTQSLIAQ